VAGIGAIAGITGIGAQQATPDASPVASPAASPLASPVATPEPVYPLAIIDEQRPEWAGTPEPGGEIRLFVRSEGIENFTPTVFQQDFQVTVSYLDPLVWVDEVTLEPRPWIAESWTWSGDGLSLAFTLRNDVVWHDGTPLTADDVRFSMLCYRDDYDSAVSFMSSVVSGIEAPEDRTVVVQFDEPDGTFPFNAANLPIFSRSQYETHWLSKPLGERTLSGLDLGDGHPLGTGPWKIVERSGSEIRFEPNEDHFAAVPLADSLVVTVDDDREAHLEAWLDDDVDIIWPLDGTKVEGLLENDGSLVVAESTTSYFAAFNFGNPTRIDPGWMASVGLREALSRAIDREGYAQSVFGGYIDVERGGIMTQPWAVDESIRNPKRDLAGARKLLADNGWSDWDGDGVLDSPSGDRGAFVCIVRDDADPSLIAILDTLNADFNEVGFELDVQRLDPDAFTARWTSTFDYDLIALSLNQYPAFTEFDLFGSAWSVRQNPAGWNPGGYWNPDVDEAIGEYLQSWEIADMRAALQRIQQVTNVDPFALWLGFPKHPVLIRPDVSGFQPNKMWQSWNTWTLWRSGEKASVVTPVPATPVSTPQAATPDAATPVGTPEGTPAAGR
jgi:peptide/nickel transport system substrate-binding protein